MTAPHQDRPTGWQLLHGWHGAAAPTPTPRETIGEAIERAGVPPAEGPPIVGPKMIVIPRGTRGEIVVRRQDHRQRTHLTIQLRLRGNRSGVAFGMSRYAARALAHAILQLLGEPIPTNEDPSR